MIKTILIDYILFENKLHHDFELEIDLLKIEFPKHAYFQNSFNNLDKLKNGNSPLASESFWLYHTKWSSFIQNKEGSLAWYLSLENIGDL